MQHSSYRLTEADYEVTNSKSSCFSPFEVPQNNAQMLMSTNNPVYESAVLAREQRRWVWSYQLRSTSFLTHSVMPAAVKTRIAPCLDILSTWQIRILLEFHPKCSNNDDQVHSSTSHGRYFDRKICLKHVYQQPFGEAWGPIELQAARLYMAVCCGDRVFEDVWFLLV